MLLLFFLHLHRYPLGCTGLLALFIQKHTGTNQPWSRTMSALEIPFVTLSQWQFYTSLNSYVGADYNHDEPEFGI